MVNINRINQSNGTNKRLMNPKIEREYSALNTSYTTAGTGDMGNLIPVHFQDVMPGQKISINNEVAIQFQPFVSNLFNEMSGEILHYFVPYRLVWDDWENFIMGGIDGKDETPIPSWTIADMIDLSINRDGKGNLIDTLFDAFGIKSEYSQDIRYMPRPVLEDLFKDFPKVNKLIFWAYNRIYNDHIRIPDFEEEVDKDNVEYLKANWDWDYFTRARIFQQRGVTPSIPISDEEQQLAHIFNITDIDGNIIEQGEMGSTSLETGILTGAEQSQTTQRFINTLKGDQGIVQVKSVYTGLLEDNEEPAALTNRLKLQPHNLEAFGVNMNDFLYSLALMRYQINNAKIEYRYIDQLQARYGVFPQDARLQRAEYIGMSTIGIGVDTVTQTAPATSAANTKQGNITGQAWGGLKNGETHNYEAKEHGVLMSLFVVRPKVGYEGGIPRIFTKETRFDYPTPEFANLPDVPIFKYELGVNTSKDKESIRNQTTEIFGWRGIYEEYRTFANRTTGKLRPSLSDGNQPLKSFTLTRYWKEDENLPEINEQFIKCNPDKERIVQYTNEPTFIYFIRNNIKTALPLPVQSEPAELANI